MAYYGEGVAAQGALAKVNPPGVQRQGTSSAEEELKKTRESLMKVVEHHLSCHRCKYPCHEVVLASCGHRFCYDCVELVESNTDLLSTERGPQCPTCGYEGITWTRLHNDDQMIQSLLQVTSPDLDAFYLAVQQRKTQDKTTREEAEGSPWKDQCELQRLKRFGRVRESTKVVVIIGFILYVIVFIIIPSKGDLTLALNRIRNPVYVSASRHLCHAARNFTRGMMRRLAEHVGVTDELALEEVEEIVAEID